MLGINDAGSYLNNGLSSLKRDILFFDKIALTGCNNVIKMGRHLGGCNLDVSNDLEFILDTSYFEVQRDDDLFDHISNANTDEKKYFNQILNELLESSANIIDRKYKTSAWIDIGFNIDKYKTFSLSRAEMDEVSRQSELHSSLFLRAIVAKLQVNGLNAVSTYRIPPWTEKIEPKLNVAEVLGLAIERVPVPDDNVPWQDILDMKEDRDLADRARKLRLWATKIAGSESSLASADEQISDLLADYSRYLAAHKIKTSSTILEAVVVGTAGMLEDLVKLKFEKIAQRIFSYRKFHAEVLMSELKAPGRELSIVTTLQDRLG